MDMRSVRYEDTLLTFIDLGDSYKEHLRGNRVALCTDLVSRYPAFFFGLFFPTADISSLLCGLGAADIIDTEEQACGLEI